MLIIGGFLILMGILQKGPLSTLLYKRSVSLRGVYWDAAIQTGKENFWLGVGLDSFGNWYRRMRSLKGATWLPGPETITNVAHNYYLDIFASGGLLLLVSYSMITVLGIVSSFRIIKNLKQFNPYAATLISMFVAFQAQALISIPQIGIAVWGWVLIGLLYSYSKQIEFGNLASTNPLRKKKIKDSNAWGLQIALASVVGFLIAIPPYSADARWTGAVNTNDLAKFESALQRSYLSPSNSDRLVSAVYILEKSNFPEKAIVYARLGVEFNSDHFDAWRSLYYATNSTPDEKSLALKNMRRLDPLNRNLDKLK